MTTKLQNPHYLPEICIRACVINFAATREGLEEQLLGDVVRNESPSLEQQKVNLVTDIATGTTTILLN